MSIGEIMEITSTKNQLVKDITKLHQKKYRDQQNLFLIEGYHLLEEAKKHTNIQTIFTTDKSIVGNNVIYVNDAVMQKVADTKHPQGVICVCEKLLPKKPKERVLILENVQDPGNVGTLLRSALAFGFDTVVLDGGADLYNDKVIRSTQGALFQLNIVQESTLSFMNMYPNFQYIGTSLEGSALAHNTFKNNIAVIVGNEGSGISKEVLSKTDINVKIPIQNIDSLNVGVAGSILMYEIKNNA
jgi:TrmH family RNA methyltransferase